MSYSLVFFLLFLLTSNKSSHPEFQYFTKKLHAEINCPDMNYNAFHKAVAGYYFLKHKGKLQNTKYLSIVDMSKSANEERYYIIDIEERKLTYKSLLAHGKNTGQEFAKCFSNTQNSLQTSLGFYTTAETYTGKNGLSMRMNGLEYCNSNARIRDIVVHNADYVSFDFIKENGRLGRSHGCPVLPVENYEEIINLIKDGSCFFIYYPNKTYFQKSHILKKSNNIQVSENGNILL